MSFSQNIKEEILLARLTGKCCRETERIAELLSESEEVTDVSTIRRNIKTNSCCKKAFLRGVFLSSGCIVDPNTEYHFEVTSKNKKNANMIHEIMNKLIGFGTKVIKRSANLYVIYSKDSEEISFILSYLGASNSLMMFENVRVEKSVKNDINRSINCETANLGKTISAAYKQISAIEKLEKLGLIDNLNTELKELCKIRKENPEMSLNDITKLYDNKITKSGINHRFKKIIAIAEKG